MTIGEPPSRAKVVRPPIHFTPVALMEVNPNTERRGAARAGPPKGRNSKVLQLEPRDEWVAYRVWGGGGDTPNAHGDPPRAWAGVGVGGSGGDRHRRFLSKTWFG